jgi:hypothetical protein
MQENKKKLKGFLNFFWNFSFFEFFFLSGWKWSNPLNLERNCHLHAEFLHANGYVAGFKVVEGKATLLGRR